MSDKEKQNMYLDDKNQRMPLSVQRSVRKQNIKFLHNRIHFSPEYFHFMKRLVQSNVQIIVNFYQHTDKSLTNVRTNRNSLIEFIFSRFRLLKISRN